MSASTRSAALEAVLPDLRCPLCRACVHAVDGQVACRTGHRFDLARQGYLNLLTGGRRGAAMGDDASMVAARQQVLTAGLFAPLTKALASAAHEFVRGTPTSLTERPSPRAPLLIDAGGGTGHHLAAVLDELRESAPAARGLVLDASTSALRRAARAHPRLASVGADVWKGLPVASDSALAILDVFSPRNLTEFHRVLHPAGALFLVVADREHLLELVEPLDLIGVDPNKDERLAAQSRGLFASAGAHRFSWQLSLTHDSIRHLVAMTPSARHIPEAALATRISRLPDPVAVTARVVLSILVPERAH